MVFFNWATMQMAAKIVYYGPGLCGKTSNLSYIYAKTAPTSRGEMVSLETESDRTLFFDLLPIEVGTIGGFKTRLQLYTVPGQVFYNTTRKLVLKGVDGVVFVADSQRPMREANIESFQSLRENLAELNVGLDELPLVLQLNKRDLTTVLSVDELNGDLNPDGAFPFYEASAINGTGVFETLKEITKLTLKKLRRRMAAPQAAIGRPRPSMPPTRSPAPLPPPPSAAPAALPPPIHRPSSISAASLARAAEEGVAEAPAAEHPAPPQQEVISPPPEPVPLPAAAAEPAESVEWQPAPEAPVEPMEPPPSVEEIPEALEIQGVATTPGTASVFLPTDEHTGALQWPPPPDAAASAAPQVSRLDGQPEGELLELDNGASAAPDAVELEVAEAVELATFEPEPAAPQSPTDAAWNQGVEPGEGGPKPAEAPPPASESDSDVDVKVEFDHTGVNLEQLAAPPQLKRVQVSNQMDILAELDGLRKQATMESYERRAASTRATELDLDALLGGDRKVCELRRRIEKTINSDIFQRMHGLQLAVRIQNKAGETIHTLDPVSLIVEEAPRLKRLSLQLTVDLENLK